MIKQDMLEAEATFPTASTLILSHRGEGCPVLGFLSGKLPVLC